MRGTPVAESKTLETNERREGMQTREQLRVWRFNALSVD
jgi:hypothetical protein